MQLFTIENLSLAAEATVLLLLLSFAWPKEKSMVTPVLQTEVGLDWEPAKYFFLQNCLHRGLYLQNWRKARDQSDHATPFVPQVSDQQENHSTVPMPWTDRLTGLLNRQGMDAVLNAWLSVDTQHRSHSCISMFALSNYSELVSSKGAMVTEQALQRISAQLVATLSNEAFVSRYLPDKFMVLHVASSLDASHQAMATVHSGIAADGFFTIAGESVPLGAVISNVDLSLSMELDNRLEQLEEGLAQAESKRQSLVSFVGDNWTTLPTEIQSYKSNTIGSQTANKESTPRESTSTTSARSSTIAKDAKSPDSLERKTADETPNNSMEESGASSDISAVANPDDIAALFAQINSNKASKASKPSTPEVSVVASEPSNATPTNTAPPVPVQGATTVSADDGAASADDIAALFASMKPSAGTSKPATATATTSASIAPAKEATRPAPADPVDLAETASLDDISALFASMRPNANEAGVPVKAAEPTPAKKAEASPSETPNAITEIDKAEVASADDISALFATVKPIASSPKPGNPAPTTQSNPIAAAPNVPEKPPAAVDVSEVATADDISALFASIKPNANAKPPNSSGIVPKQVSKPIVSNAPVDSQESQKSAMSSDDISALFASIKPVDNRVDAAVTKAAIEKAVSAKPAMASAPEIDLAEAATVDDISALFATVKPAVTPKSVQAEIAEDPRSVSALNTPNAAVLASKPTNQNTAAALSGEQLSDAATADDIAALFSTIKPAAASPPQSKPTVAAPAPIVPKILEQDLTASASSDDISALFAAFKN